MGGFHISGWDRATSTITYRLEKPNYRNHNYQEGPFCAFLGDKSTSEPKFQSDYDQGH